MGLSARKAHYTLQSICLQTCIHMPSYSINPNKNNNKIINVTMIYNNYYYNFFIINTAESLQCIAISLFKQRLQESNYGITFNSNTYYNH